MFPRALGWFPLLLAASLSTAAAANRCRLVMTPPLPVRMEDLRPVIATEINGAEARFIVDTGSFFDFLSPAAAAEFKLPLTDAPTGYYVSGIGGSFVPRIATAKTFSVAGISGHDAAFLVGSNDFGGGIAGILGQNIFRIADVDFDFANGALRFVKPQHCGGDTMAYWATTQAIGVVDVDWTSVQRTHLIAKAAVNGHNIHVLFDTGAWRSILSLDAARRAGITPESPGVVPAGATFGLGSRVVKVWAAPIDKFEIGGETIEHSHLLIGDIALDDADMLLGSDFFLAHHIYVAYSQDKVYFTYNGGPVFDVTALPPAKTKTVGATPVAEGTAANTPNDAAGFLRRGLADASRGELQQALADLTRAAQLDPHDPECFYQRGLVYWRNGQRQLALQDFTAALALDPNDYRAHFSRAQLDLPKMHAGIEDDLDAVDRLAPPEADLRLALGGLYHAIGQYAAAVHQYDLWIGSHGDDRRLVNAVGTRCGLQAGANIDLDRALDDCNRALGAQPASDRGALLSNRSLVYLRLSQFDRTIADDNASIQLRPQSPYPYYLRGLAELRKGLTAAGRADLAAAQKMQPDIGRHYAEMGLTP
jgi:tetratricopeptide (TPR) repeat protein/predicted aspartyl protease